MGRLTATLMFLTLVVAIMGCGIHGFLQRRVLDPEEEYIHKLGYEREDASIVKLFSGSDGIVKLGVFLISNDLESEDSTLKEVYISFLVENSTKRSLRVPTPLPPSLEINLSDEEGQELPKSSSVDFRTSVRIHSDLVPGLRHLYAKHVSIEEFGYSLRQIRPENQYTVEVSYKSLAASDEAWLGKIEGEGSLGLDLSQTLCAIAPIGPIQTIVSTRKGGIEISEFDQQRDVWHTEYFRKVPPEFLSEVRLLIAW